MIAGTLPDDMLPADTVPIIYLPGVSRAKSGPSKSVPRPSSRWRALQYRGVLWTHKNGHDWTVAGFLQEHGRRLGHRGKRRHRHERSARPRLGSSWRTSRWARLKRRRPLQGGLLRRTAEP